MSNAPDVTVRDIYLARRRIAGIARKTPLVVASELSERIGARVHLKLETAQDTGTFKVRGAANKILALDAEARARGVVTVSTGNHGRACAHVARHVGARTVVCLSALVPRNKVEAVRQSGAELVIHGKNQDDAGEEALRLEREQGLTMVNPFDDALVIAGQGTIGLEILEELPDVDTVLVPVGGGGLVSGIALALKAADPAIRVVGVQMERGPVMYASQKAGKPILVDEEETLADSLGGGIFLDNRYTFRMVRDYVDDIVLVSEDEIGLAMAYALGREHLVLEGGGAVGIAALLTGKAGPLGARVAVVVSGGNVDIDRLAEIYARWGGRL